MRNEEPVEAFPLAWPSGWPRTDGYRSTAPYKVTGARALDDLRAELRLLGAVDIVISSNVPLRRDGQLYAEAATQRIKDPGVAVYFRRKLKGERQVIACDKWARPESNIRAIGLCVEAMRAISRSGASELLDRAFTGFKALPPAGGTSQRQEWFVVFGLRADAKAIEIKERYRELAARHHPDKGGDSMRMAEINEAYELVKSRGLLA